MHRSRCLTHRPGEFGDVKVDGLSVALAVHSPGHMAEVKWKVALSLDEKARAARR